VGGRGAIIELFGPVAHEYHTPAEALGPNGSLPLSPLRRTQWSPPPSGGAPSFGAWPLLEHGRQWAASEEGQPERSWQLLGSRRAELLALRYAEVTHPADRAEDSAAGLAGASGLLAPDALYG